MRNTLFVLLTLFVTFAGIAGGLPSANAAGQVCYDYHVVLFNGNTTPSSFDIALTDAPTGGNVLLGPTPVSIAPGGTATVRLVGYIPDTPDVPYISPGGFILVPPPGVTLVTTINDGPVAHAVCQAFIASGGGASEPPGDGRVNWRDRAAPVAIYCEPGGGLVVYDILADGSGNFAFRVSYDDIVGDESPPAENRLIASGQGASLYYLASGELQVNAEGLPSEEFKEYVFRWAECPTGGAAGA